MSVLLAACLVLNPLPDRYESEQDFFSCGPVFASPENAAAEAKRLGLPLIRWTGDVFRLEWNRQVSNRLAGRVVQTWERGTAGKYGYIHLDSWDGPDRRGLKAYRFELWDRRDELAGPHCDKTEGAKEFAAYVLRVSQPRK